MPTNAIEHIQVGALSMSQIRSLHGIFNRARWGINDASTKPREGQRGLKSSGPSSWLAGLLESKDNEATLPTHHEHTIGKSFSKLTAGLTVEG